MAYQGGPLAGGYQYQPWSPTEGLPGGLGMQVAGQLGMSYFEQQTGMVPMGFYNSGNPYSTLNRQLFDQAHRDGMTRAAQRDQQFMMESMRGMAAVSGVRWGADQQRASQNIIDFYNQAPPEARALLSSTLTGGRSAIDFYNHLHLGGRYGMDPVTGFRGVSANTSAAMASQLTDHYYGTQEAWRTRAMGLSSGQMGGLYDALQRRGMGADPGDLRSRVAGALNSLDAAGQQRVLREAGIDVGTLSRTPHGYQLDAEQVEKLSGLEEIQGGMRTQHTGRVLATLDRYKGAVKAMQEIFGDAGHPNAPMEQIFQALEQLTAGSLQQMDAGRAEMLVRNFQSLTRTAGISAEGAMAMLGDAGQVLQGMGINRAFQLPTTLNALSVMAAMQDTGALSRPVWGLGTAEELGAMEQRRYAGAVKSPAANRFGLAMRLAERLGGFAEGSDAARLVQQLQSGEVSEEFALMNDQGFVEMMARSTGMTPTEIEQQLRYSTLNEPFIFEHGLGGVVRRAQSVEFGRKVLGRAFEAQIASTMYARTGNASPEVAASAARVLEKAWLEMPDAIFDDKKRRLGAMRRELRVEFEKTEEGRAFLASLGDTREQQDIQLNLLAEGAEGRGERDYRRMDPNGYLINVRKPDSPEVQQRTRVQQERAMVESLLGSAMAGTLDSSAVTRFMRGLQDAGLKPDRATLLDLMGRTLGGVPREELEKTIIPAMLDVYSQSADVEKEREAIGKKMDAGTATPEEIARYKQLGAKAAALGENLNKLRAISEEKKLAEETAKRAGEGDQAAAGGGGSAGPENVVIQGATIYLNGEPVLANAESTIRTGGPGRGSTPNAGMS